LVNSFIYFYSFDGISNCLLRQLAIDIEKEFKCKVRIVNKKGLPSTAFNAKRSQYNASRVIDVLARDLPQDAIKVLAITKRDLYAPTMNFVFGQAQLGGRCAIISLFRLNDHSKNNKLLYERSLKEAVHELGHTFGLDHCSKSSCVMYFSRTLLDTDKKSSNFCSLHKNKLFQ
jgi:archaemetzincin